MISIFHSTSALQGEYFTWDYDITSINNFVARTQSYKNDKIFVVYSQYNNKPLFVVVICCYR